MDGGTIRSMIGSRHRTAEIPAHLVGAAEQIKIILDNLTQVARLPTKPDLQVCWESIVKSPGPNDIVYAQFCLAASEYDPETGWFVDISCRPGQQPLIEISNVILSEQKAAEIIAILVREDG